jgi:hypothetical protein
LKLNAFGPKYCTSTTDLIMLFSVVVIVVA